LICLPVDGGTLLLPTSPGVFEARAPDFFEASLQRPVSNIAPDGGEEASSPSLPDLSPPMPRFVTRNWHESTVPLSPCPFPLFSSALCSRPSSQYVASHQPSMNIFIPPPILGFEDAFPRSLFHELISLFFPPLQKAFFHTGTCKRLTAPGTPTSIPSTSVP